MGVSRERFGELQTFLGGYMGGDLNKIHQLRMITEYCPPDYQPIKHPTEIEIMDKLNEVIKMVNFIVEHYLEVNDER